MGMTNLKWLTDRQTRGHRHRLTVYIKTYAQQYPSDGLYSSKDPQVLDRHMTQISGAGIGVIVLSWWRKGWGSEKVETDSAARGVLDAADRAGLKVCFHLE
jgi:glycoprotein endo-alpha-1,2-mannosidase